MQKQMQIQLMKKKIWTQSKSMNVNVLWNRCNSKMYRTLSNRMLIEIFCIAGVSVPHHLRQHVCPNTGPWPKSKAATSAVSPLSSQCNSNADVECLTASTTAEPTAFMNANDNDNMVTASRSCSRCGSINSTKSAIIVPSNQLNDEHEFEGAIKVSTPSLRYKRCESNLSDEEDQPHLCNR